MGKPRKKTKGQQKKSQKCPNIKHSNKEPKEDPEAAMEVEKSESLSGITLGSDTGRYREMKPLLGSSDDGSSTSECSDVSPPRVSPQHSPPSKPGHRYPLRSTFETKQCPVSYADKVKGSFREKPETLSQVKCQNLKRSNKEPKNDPEVAMEVEGSECSSRQSMHEYRNIKPLFGSSDDGSSTSEGSDVSPPRVSPEHLPPSKPGHRYPLRSTFETQHHPMSFADKVKGTVKENPETLFCWKDCAKPQQRSFPATKTGALTEGKAALSASHGGARPKEWPSVPGTSTNQQPSRQPYSLRLRPTGAYVAASNPQKDAQDSAARISSSPERKRRGSPGVYQKSPKDKRRITRRRPAPKNDKSNIRKIQLPPKYRKWKLKDNIPDDIWHHEISYKHFKTGKGYYPDKSYFCEDIDQQTIKNLICITAKNPDKIHDDERCSKQWYLFREFDDYVGFDGKQKRQCFWIFVTSKKGGYMVNAYPYLDPRIMGKDIGISFH